jgi:hypothetical protein
VTNDRRPEWHLLQKHRGGLSDGTFLLVCDIYPDDNYAAPSIPLLVRGEIDGWPLAQQIVALLNLAHTDPHERDVSGAVAVLTDRLRPD